MLSAEQNDLITRIGPGTAAGSLLRHYWQPAALVDELSGNRPVKPIKLMGENLVLFRDTSGRYGLIDRSCPHRGTDLAYGRLESDGLRCPFHGWLFDHTGKCLETPAEPDGSNLCANIRQKAYPVVERSGILFAYMGPGEPPAFPHFDCFVAPNTHTFAFKGLIECNWLQSLEVGIDPAHTSFLHRFLQDETLDGAYGRQFRSATAGDVGGQRWPMTRVMREFHRPEIRHEAVADGLTRITTLRRIDETLMHVRVTHAAFPSTFVIPLSETITITQMHVPVDDTHNYWYAFFTSFTGPVDKDAMRTPRLQAVTLPDYVPKSGRHNNWCFNAEEQQTRTYLGMGEDDINLHDQWAVESMGPIQDRTKEHLGTSDKVIMANRRTLLKAIETVRAGGRPPMALSDAEAERLTGPDTIDCIAPAEGWDRHWTQAAAAKRAGAAWLAAGQGVVDPEARSTTPAEAG
jgi:phenylpropionate dioxygenase-like ring-hydroxylating dioxygenase large terminal subunit